MQRVAAKTIDNICSSRLRAADSSISLKKCFRRCSPILNGQRASSFSKSIVTMVSSCALQWGGYQNKIVVRKILRAWSRAIDSSTTYQLEYQLYPNIRMGHFRPIGTILRTSCVNFCKCKLDARARSSLRMGLARMETTSTCCELNGITELRVESAARVKPFGLEPNSNAYTCYTRSQFIRRIAAFHIVSNVLQSEG